MCADNSLLQIVILEIRPVIDNRFLSIIVYNLTIMNLQLNDKAAIVLAASKGLGRAIAKTLSAEGAKVIIGSRNEKELQQAANEISNETGNKVIAIPVDVSNGDDLASFIEQAAECFGRIDILLNNAGGPPFDQFENIDDAQWQKAFELNLLSFARTSRQVLPYMKKTGSGRIINIISGSVKSVLASSVLSTSMRMGVIGMAKMLATELGPDNITVNNVAPGSILTDRLRHTMMPSGSGGPSFEELMALRVKEIPLGRIGKPEELAALVAFLASDAAGYVNGTSIPVDGGRTGSI